MSAGKAFLVGAGPGDPGLITLKGLECLKKADVVLYDQLLDPKLLDWVRPDAEKVYVGKTGRHHSMEQGQINRLLVEKVAEGKVVVRLKGGDPFVFGRGGEEAEALAEAGLPFEIVPGVTSAVAVPAYAGIPVTHRGVASSFAVVTGHEAGDKAESTIAWDRLATATDTLVFLMGAGNLSSIVAHLVANGRSPSTPIMLVHRGTTPHQRTLVGTLDDIAVRSEREGFQPPVVIVVGEVVKLRDRLRWFDSQPLFGKRVLVTRSRGQASAMSAMLAERGAYPVEMPVISIQAVPDIEKLDQAVRALPNYDWVVFTSVNGVDAFAERMKALKLDARHLSGVCIAAIGEATASALEKLSLRADYVPQEYTGDGLLAGLKQVGVRGRRFLLLRADIAGPKLGDGLRQEGAVVDDVAAYRTVTATEDVAIGREALLSGQVDIVTFTSSSTVRNLVAALDSDLTALAGTVVACIGPVTARTARDFGLRIDVVADRHTIPGLVEAIEQYLQHTVMREGI